MPEIQFIDTSEVKISEDRFRKVFSEQTLSDLQKSISSGLGLINAITVREDFSLITGETRLKAITALHTLGEAVFFNGEEVPSGKIPALVLESDFDEIAYLQSEFDENAHRESFTYIEEAQAIARIAKLKEAIRRKDSGETEKPKMQILFLRQKKRGKE